MSFSIEPKVFMDMIERQNKEELVSLGGVNGIVAALKANATQGLSNGDLQERKDFYGENKLPPEELQTLWEMILDALKDKIIIMLMICAVVSIILGLTVADPQTGKVDRGTGWIEGFAILVSVCLVVGLGSFSNYTKQQKFQELNQVNSVRTVSVVRNGKKVDIDSTELVVGDVLVIECGQNMCVDCVLLDSQDLKTDESNATGESDQKKKGRDRDEFIISGSDIVEGEGHGLVIGVGVNSFSGSNMMKTRQQSEDKKTPLETKLGVLADKIGWFGMVAAALTFIVLAIVAIINWKQGKGKLSPVSFLDFLIVAITIVVVAIPEGLPLAVTITLAFSMKAMINDNCLVRELSSCETMAGCTAICSDKTGTLTENKMTVVQGWIGGEDFVFDGVGVNGPAGATIIAPDAKSVPLKFAEPMLAQLAEALSFNTTADKIKNENGEEVWVGNKTEHGLLGFVERYADFHQTRASVTATSKRTYPFHSQKKRMTTIVKKIGQSIVYVKGASELVLEDCSEYYSHDMSLQTMTTQKKEELKGRILLMADQGNRTLAIACRKADYSAFPEEEPTESNLCLLAILAMQDPIRKEVPGAVSTLQNAGIIVRMVTGDNLHTAMAIAKKCGIFHEGVHEAVEGKDFRDLHEKNLPKFNALLPRLRVIARSSPTDKYILVKSLMAAGEIVAVTGDGTNDAPALSEADVGFAMFSGTDVAKGASKMILMDNNFASVVNATKWGRTVNSNVKKFLQFQLTVNCVGVLLTLLGSVISSANSSPLSPVQLLWLNLIMDTFAALALATEKPCPYILEERPVSRTASLITMNMWSFILPHAVFQLLITLLIVNFGHKWFSVGVCLEDELMSKMDHGDCKMGVKHRTIVFNVFIWFQIFNEYNARSLNAGEWNPFARISKSIWFIIISLIMIAFQLFAVCIAGKFMDTHPISFGQWLICVAFALTVFPIHVLVKLLQIFVVRGAKDTKATKARSLNAIEEQELA